MFIFAKANCVIFKLYPIDVIYYPEIIDINISPL